MNTQRPSMLPSAPPLEGPQTLESLLRLLIHCDHPARCLVNGAAVEVVSDSPERFVMCSACGSLRFGDDEQWIRTGLTYAIEALEPLEALARLRAFTVEGLELPALAEIASPGSRARPRSRDAVAAIVKLVESLSVKLVGAPS
jgi:hypothetical protein